MKVFAKGIIAAGLFVLFVSMDADAQTRGKAKPLATPPPVLSGAEIISRAGELVETQPVDNQEAEKPVKRASGDATQMRDLMDRVNKLESTQKPDYDEKQKRLLLNLDILTRAEQRSESLRKQLFDMIEKENSIRSRLDQIEFDIRPEMIERTLQLAGSMKPEQIRDSRRKSLEAERQNLLGLMTDIQTTRTSLNTTLQKAELMVDKLRFKLEKDIDDALLSDDE